MLFLNPTAQNLTFEAHLLSHVYIAKSGHAHFMIKC